MKTYDESFPKQHLGLMTQYWGKVSSINLFSEADLLELEKISHQTGRRYRKYNGGTFIISGINWGSMYDMLYPKLKTCLAYIREDDIISGNLYITRASYGLHLDGIDENEVSTGYVPIKSFLIPLWNLPKKKVSSLIFMSNRFLGFERTFQKGYENSNPYFVDKLPNIYDYSDITWYNYDKTELDKNDKFDKSIHHAYLPHIKLETFDEMKVEEIVNFVPGELIIFDTLQLHVSTNINVSNVNLKSGIRLILWRKL